MMYTYNPSTQGLRQEDGSQLEVYLAIAVLGKPTLCAETLFQQTKTKRVRISIPDRGHSMCKQKSPFPACREAPMAVMVWLTDRLPVAS